MTGESPGYIHADIPIGGSPAFRCFVQIVVQACILEVRKPFLDGFFSLAADPEPMGGTLVIGELQNPAGDQLPFTAGISGDDYALNISSFDQVLDNCKLVLALLDDLLLQHRRQHGKITQGPSLVTLAVSSRLGQFHQMPQCPGDNVVFSLNIPGFPPVAVQNTRQLSPNTRLLSKYKLFQCSLLHTA
ncbi:hypothetical protein DSECCO2_552630 [anaerobic digester metagenome]